jgi:acyl carrier protein phosphodiesterase
MNYLVHLQLSDPQPLCRIGNLMGDFVKGRLQPEDWPPLVLKGLRQHRALDRLSQDHPAVQASKRKLDERFGLLKPILIDIFYDHLLAKNWPAWIGGDLESFAAETYRQLTEHQSLLVPGFHTVTKRMIEHNWLVSYRDPKVIHLVLKRIGQRLSRPNLLAEGHYELERCGREMEKDCRLFLAAAQRMLASPQ